VKVVLLGILGVLCLSRSKRVSRSVLRARRKKRADKRRADIRIFDAELVKHVLRGGCPFCGCCFVYLDMALGPWVGFCNDCGALLNWLLDDLIDLGPAFLALDPEFLAVDRAI